MSRIEVRNLTKKYGAVTALDDVSVTIGDNRIYGLLGAQRRGEIHAVESHHQPHFPNIGRGADRRRIGAGKRQSAEESVLHERTALVP